MTDNKRLDEILELVKDEFISASFIHGKFYDAHHGYAILLEEVNELWSAIKDGKYCVDNKEIREEAIQVAAMAVRLTYDLIDEVSWVETKTNLEHVDLFDIDLNAKAEQLLDLAETLSSKEVLNDPVL